MVVLTSLLSLLVAGVLLYQADHYLTRQRMVEEAESIAGLLGSHSAASLMFLDQKTAAESLGTLTNLGHIEAACLFDTAGQVFASYQRIPGAATRCTTAVPETAGDAIEIRRPVMAEDRHVGQLRLLASLTPLRERSRVMLLSMLLAFGVAFALAVGFGLGLQRSITRPLGRVQEVAAEVVRTGNYACRARLDGDDELARMAQAIDAMLDTIEHQRTALADFANALESKVEQRTRELADSNTQLSEALDILQRTQTDLIRQEKMASLGVLVAGVAHELNTPLGNAVMVCSSLVEEIRRLEADVAGGTLRKSRLTEALAALHDGFDLAMRNLTRAAELVTSFKQVAVDQTSDRRRVFDLGHFLGEVVDTLRPSFKGRPVTLAIEAPAGIVMDSFPGQLAQVITNLVLNAQLHAFEEGTPGRIVLRAAVLDEAQVEITVEDNGRGIPADHLSRVFDPFFTTRLGQGGSGLGLNIVYNIVTALGGRITVDSTPGYGAQFRVVILRVA